MLLSALLVGAALGAPSLDIASTEPPGCAHAKQSARVGATETLPSPETLVVNEDTDALHYHLDLELDPGAAWLGGSNTMTVKSLVDGLDAFRFRLDDVFAITDVRVDGAAAGYVRLDGATLEVTLDPPRQTGETFELLVAYNGFPQSEGFGSIVFRTRGGAQEVWTLSEPWFAHTWWPGKDDNRDKTTADLWFTVPDELIVASNGVLEGVDNVAGDRLRYRWKTEYPTADYLYCFGATNYNVFGEMWNYDGGVMPLDFYIYPEDDNGSNRDAWRANVEMLDVFSNRYGLYPFADEKYGMCQVGFGGGMEHQTMTSQGGFWESITAHELAHQWFGDFITCATWHDIWLNEGFATFSEAIWFGEEPGGGGMAAYHDRMETRRPGRVDGSVYVYDISDPSRIFSGDFTYRKAAWVLHMLRHALTDDVFFDVIAEYRSVLGYQSATTDDFQIVAENISGRELDWFFDAWVYDIGAPAYRYAWRPHHFGGHDYVELYVKQVQDQDYPIFTMPIDVHTDGAGGAEVSVVWNDTAAEHLLFEVGGAVSNLQLDPEDWTLHTSNQVTSFVEGPPKIVGTAPAPGEIVPQGPGFAAEVVFHKNVVVDAAHVTLVGDAAGTIPTTFAYDAATHTVSIAAEVVLLPDTYTLRVDDGVVDVAAGLALDGELSDPADPAALPSGDGLPGGAAVVTFTVPGVYGDVDGDGAVGFSDILLLLGQWGDCPPPPDACPADIDGNGLVDFADLLIVLGNWT